MWENGLFPNLDLIQLAREILVAQKMDVQSLLGKLDNLNKEGSIIQEQIKSVDEQLSKTELDINIIQVVSIQGNTG